MPIEQTLETLDYMLDTRSKRHVVGGILLSASLLFAGLAITVMTMDKSDTKKGRRDE